MCFTNLCRESWLSWGDKLSHSTDRHIATEMFTTEKVRSAGPAGRTILLSAGAAAIAGALATLCKNAYDAKVVPI